MPFSEFRFLNGSRQNADSDVTVQDTATGQTQLAAVPAVPPKQEAIVPPNPPPIPNDTIVQAQVVVQGQPPRMLQAPIQTPDGTDFQTIATVISEGQNADVLCVVIGKTMGGAQICQELV